MKLPNSFINSTSDAKIVRFTTLELQKKNARVDEAFNEVLLMSENTIEQVIEPITTELQNLYEMSEAVALLDLISVFAKLGLSGDYVRPEHGATIVIKNGRHPMFERNSEARFVANDTYGDSDRRFQIITGCNMAGKSMYLRQVALILIMAQIGCFVPASYACLPVMNRLLTRISSDDGEDLHSAGFAAEMAGIAHVVQEASGTSISLIDELGRGTSTEDSLAINLSICEHLIANGGFVLYATHFWQLQCILQFRLGVICLNLDAVHDTCHGSKTLIHRISEGTGTRSCSALSLARTTSLAPSLILRGESLSMALHRDAATKHQSSKSGILKEKRQLILRLCGTLRQAGECSKNLAVSALKGWLSNLHSDLSFSIENSLQTN